MNFFIVCFISVTIAVKGKNLDTIHQWKYFDYLWNSREHKSEYINNGDYNHTSIVAIDVDVAEGK